MRAFIKAIDRTEASRRKAGIFDQLARNLKNQELLKYIDDLDVR